MGLSQLNFDGNNKVQAALKRIIDHASEIPYYFADSYGKDSSCVRRLLQMAHDSYGIQFEGHYSQGGIDPPELVRFGRDFHPQLAADRQSRPGPGVIRELFAEMRLPNSGFGAINDIVMAELEAKYLKLAEGK